MKHAALLLAMASFVAFTSSSSIVHAVATDVTDPAVPSALERSRLIVSAVPLAGAQFIELHNQTEQAVSLRGYSLVFIFAVGEKSHELVVPLPDKVYVVADGYVTIGTKANAYVDIEYSLDDTYQSKTPLAIELEKDNKRVRQIENAAPTNIKYTWLKRKSGSSGMGAAQGNFTQKQSPAEIYGYGLFIPPETKPSVKIVEIYPRASDCSPTDTSVLCRDYIKLHNASEFDVNLGEYRLRSDSGSSLNGNAFGLGIIPAGGYLTVSSRDDGNAMSLTDSGGYVWLEDRAGVAPYESTMRSYPSATTSYIGWSWALDGGSWQWTSTPQPNALNVITIPVEDDPEVVADTDTPKLAACAAGKFRNPETNRCKKKQTASTLVPCRTGQERNPLTNRCKSTVLASANLTPCGPGQTRNPATNRCKSQTSASSSLVPCKPGQTRNPETNRCKSTSAAASSLVPCKPEQERNPETNRCRKSSSATLAASAGFENVSSESAATEPTSWYMLAGIIGVVAGGYGLWEWRSEIAGATKRLLGGLKSP